MTMSEEIKQGYFDVFLLGRRPQAGEKIFLGGLWNLFRDWMDGQMDGWMVGRPLGGGSGGTVGSLNFGQN